MQRFRPVQFSLSIFGFLLLSACQTTGENALSPTPQTPVAKIAELPADPDPALWVVKDADTTIFLFGTVHLLRPGTRWFDDEVKRAFDDSQELVTEMIDPDPSEAAKVTAELAMNRSGTSLRSKLNDEDRAAYEKVAGALALPLEPFDALDPWFVSINLSLVPLLRAGFEVEQGAEKLLVAEATARKLKHVGLESYDQQMGFFDNLPLASQIAFLNSAVKTMPDAVPGMEQMIGHWARAETDELAQMMNEGLEDPLLYRTLLVDRNQRWANWIAKRLEQPGTVFFAVGAGHLAGKESVQAQLAARGIATSRVVD